MIVAILIDYDGEEIFKEWNLPIEFISAHRLVEDSRYFSKFHCLTAVLKLKEK